MNQSSEYTKMHTVGIAVIRLSVFSPRPPYAKYFYSSYYTVLSTQHTVATLIHAKYHQIKFNIHTDPIVGLDKICFFFFLFCFSFMLDKSTYFAFPIHPFCSLFHPFCFPKNFFFAFQKISFLHTVIKVQTKLENLMSKVVLQHNRELEVEVEDLHVEVI